MNYVHPLTERAREAGYSNRRLAALTGLSPSYVDRLTRPNLADVNAIRRPSIEALQSLAAALDCDPRDLVDHGYQVIVYELPADQPVIENVPEAVVPRDLQDELRRAISTYGRSEHASRYLNTAALAATH